MAPLQILSVTLRKPALGATVTMTATLTVKEWKREKERERLLAGQ